MKSIMFWIQKTARAVQRVAAVRPEVAPTDGQLATLRALAAELSERRKPEEMS